MCEGDFRQVGPHAPGAAQFPRRGIAQEQGGIVAPQRFGSREDRVVRGPKAQDRLPVFGRRDHQPPGTVVVQVAVGRRGER